MEKSSKPSQPLETTSLVFHNPDLRVGFHIGVVATPDTLSLSETFSRMVAAPLQSYQVSISHSYSPPTLEPLDLLQARTILARNYKYACIHGSLIYNLAGSVRHRRDPQFQFKLEHTCAALASELDTATILGSGVVVHVGTCEDRERGMFTVSKAVDSVLTRETPQTKILARTLGVPVSEYLKSRRVILENSSGSLNGHKLGNSLAEMATIINKVNPTLQPQVQVCIDTAHLFASGEFDLGSRRKVDRFFRKFESTIGMDRLAVIHLNDSRVEFNSQKDRHENLGLGCQFGSDQRKEGLARILWHAERHRIPLIGEPPGNNAEGAKGPGGMYDYRVLKEVCPSLYETHHCC